jgi:hypothetical protein
MVWRQERSEGSWSGRDAHHWISRWDDETGEAEVCEFDHAHRLMRRFHLSSGESSERYLSEYAADGSLVRRRRSGS